jgi:hypothetical protein
MNWQDLDPIFLIAGGAGVVVLLLAALWAWLRRARRPRERAVAELAIDITQLDDSGPPAGHPRLEFYGTAVRLAVVVVAPGGRSGELPPADVLPGLMERVVPGMTNIIASHRPMICRWPTQLSSQGFANAFFNQVALPGSRGKGTPWCSIAGKITVGERSFLIGLVFCAESPNSLSQVIAQHEGQWLDILRIRKE